MIENKNIVMRYKHDCDTCIPLGQFQENDIYFCGSLNNKANDTVVSRYGNKPEDYISGLHLTGRSEIKVAVAMAKAAGYITEE